MDPQQKDDTSQNERKRVSKSAVIREYFRLVDEEKAQREVPPASGGGGDDHDSVQALMGLRLGDNTTKPAHRGGGKGGESVAMLSADGEVESVALDYELNKMIEDFVEENYEGKNDEATCVQTRGMLRACAVAGLFTKESFLAFTTTGLPKLLQTQMVERDGYSVLPTDGLAQGVVGGPTAKKPAASDGAAKTVYPDSANCEYTVVILRPFVSESDVGVVHKRLLAQRFELILGTKLQAAKEVWMKFYKQHRHEKFFDKLTTEMASGSVVCLVLRRANAIEACRALVGPFSVKRALREAPTSLRATLTARNGFNALHCTKTVGEVIDALRYIHRSFAARGEISIARQLGDILMQITPPSATNPEIGSDELPYGIPSPEKHVLCPSNVMFGWFSVMLLRSDLAKILARDLYNRLASARLQIARYRMVEQPTEYWQKFYSSRKTWKFFPEFTAYLAEQPVLAMVVVDRHVEGEKRKEHDPIQHCLAIAGLGLVDEARAIMPTSLGALYGMPGEFNPVFTSANHFMARAEAPLLSFQ